MSKCFKCKKNNILGNFLIVGKTPTGRPKPESQSVCADCLPTIERAVCYKCGTNDVDWVYNVFQEESGKYKKLPICENCKDITPVRGNVFSAGHIPSKYQYTEMATFPLVNEDHIILHCKNESCQKGFLIFEMNLDKETKEAHIQQMARTNFCPFCGKENGYLI